MRAIHNILSIIKKKEIQILNKYINNQLRLPNTRQCKINTFGQNLRIYKLNI